MPFTFPCRIGHRIVELTEEQAQTVVHQQMTDKEHIAELYQRIADIEIALRWSGINIEKSHRDA